MARRPSGAKAREWRRDYAASLGLRSSGYFGGYPPGADALCGDAEIGLGSVNTSQHHLHT